MDEFHALMEQQRRRAQEQAKRGGAAGDALASAAARAGPTEFVGYERLEADTRIGALLVGGAEVPAALEGQDVQLLLLVTPFYAEGGGQVGDTGVVRTAGGSIRIADAVWGPG